MHRLRAIALPTTLGLAFVLSGRGMQARADGAGEVDAGTRLRRLPPERRDQLSANLERFRALPSDQQAAIRELDSALESLNPADRDRYLDVLRRYHLWVQDLPPQDRAELGRLAPEARLKWIADRAARQRQAASTGGGPRPDLKPGILVGGSVFRLASLIRIWQALNAEQRRPFLSSAPAMAGAEAEHVRRLAELGRSLEIEPVVPSEEEAARLAGHPLGPDLRALMAGAPPPGRPSQLDAEASEAETPSTADAGLPDPAFDVLWLADHPGRLAVTEANLRRFEADLPDWLRSPLDPLTAAEASRRLRILYRLVYPAGGEMPVNPAAAKPKPPEAPRAGNPAGGVAF